jgi:DNA processing protein
MSEDELALWLAAVPGISGKRAKALIKRFGSVKELWSASEREIRAYSSLPPEAASALIKSRGGALELRLKELNKRGCSYVSIFNERYPALLKAIEDAPLGLYVMGRLPESGKAAAALIGSRRCSEYGLSAAGLLGKGLAENGVTVVSGMARGIDGQAHRAAIEAGGETIAVLGSGLDICYPPEHKRLMEDIARHGAVISEYPFGTPPDKFNFPARNRIVSGVSGVVIVVESEERSGTSITVSKALEQGRTVMAVPGSVFSRFSKGTNYLIYCGAAPVLSVDDVLFELKKDIPAREARGGENAAKQALDGDENLVYAHIGFEPAQIDEVIRKSGLTVQKTRHALFQLEMEGIIQRLPGERYKRAP